MQRNTFGKVMIVLAIVAALAIAGTALAGWGRGYGWGYGSDWCPRAGYGPGTKGYAPGYSEDLDDEEMAKLEAQRETFWKETSQLRDQLYQKELELQSELAKPDPDLARASGLQKEISDLRAQMDQKWIEHRVQMRKAAPDYGYRGQGCGARGPMMGQGYGPRGPMMGQGYGPRGPMMGRGGYCW